MAFHESSREDLLREATALVERAELQVTGFAESVIVGFRRDGAASFFFGADPVYQFNAAGELRRAFVGGLLYKAEWGKLVALRRERGEGIVALIRGELNDGETAAFMVAMQEQLSQLRAAFVTKSVTVVGEVSRGNSVVAGIGNWLGEIHRPIAIANAPNVAR
jgi:hypothetical protein